MSLCLAAALVFGAAGVQAADQDKGNNPVLQFTGSVWQKSSLDNKLSFLFGMDTAIATEYFVNSREAELADARRDNSPPGGVITPSKSLLHICQQNYKNEGRGNFPPPCFYVLRRCLVNAGSQVAACSSCGLASGFSPLVSRATA